MTPFLCLRHAKHNRSLLTPTINSFNIKYRMCSPKYVIKVHYWWVQPIQISWNGSHFRRLPNEPAGGKEEGLGISLGGGALWHPPAISLYRINTTLDKIPFSKYNLHPAYVIRKQTILASIVDVRYSTVYKEGLLSPPPHSLCDVGEEDSPLFSRTYSDKIYYPPPPPFPPTYSTPVRKNPLSPLKLSFAADHRRRTFFPFLLFMRLSSQLRSNIL